jgi:hypothetical protein
MEIIDLTQPELLDLPDVILLQILDDLSIPDFERLRATSHKAENRLKSIELAFYMRRIHNLHVAIVCVEPYIAEHANIDADFLGTETWMIKYQSRKELQQSIKDRAGLNLPGLNFEPDSIIITATETKIMEAHNTLLVGWSSHDTDFHLTNQDVIIDCSIADLEENLEKLGQSSIGDFFEIRND